jgi:hypothetical protein
MLWSRLEQQVMSMTQKRIITWLVVAVGWGIALWLLISTTIFPHVTPTPYRYILFGIGGICVVIRFILAR